MYSYQSELNNFLIFSSFHSSELKNDFEIMFQKYTELYGKTKKDLGNAKMILANNDIEYTTINNVHYRYLEYEDDSSFYNAEIAEMEISIFKDRNLLSHWAELKDGFHVYASFSIDEVDGQIIFYELGS